VFWWFVFEAAAPSHTHKKKNMEKSAEAPKEEKKEEKREKISEHQGKLLCSSLSLFFYKVGFFIYSDLDGPGYKWQQTLKDVTVKIPIPANVRGHPFPFLLIVCFITLV
jgi:hypothetical protein